VVTGSGGSAAIYWVHANHIGVPLVTTDSSGAVATPAGYTVLGFPGQTRTLADLYYNRYRDYDSSLGRYIQADPIGPAGGVNSYLYAEANPLSLIDPMGLNPVVVEGAIAVGEGFAEGFVWWCRSNIALCARTVGPPIVRAANACNALIRNLTGDDDDDDCEIEYERDRATCRSAWRFVAQDGLAVCYKTAFERLQECRFKGGARTPLFLPPRRRGRWNY